MFPGFKALFGERFGCLALGSPWSLKMGSVVIVADACPDFGSSKRVFVCLSVIIFVACVLIKEMFF